MSGRTRNRYKTIPNFLILMGLCLTLAGIASTISGREIEPLITAAFVGMPMMGAGAFLAFARARAIELLERRRQNEVDHQQRLNIARAHGAEPGQLMEVPPENGAGDLSLPQRDGALSIAKKQPQ